MKIKTLSVILFICAICLPFSAMADPISIPITLTGTSGVVSNGYYIDPYKGTVNGVPNTVIYCVDFLHDSYLNDSWTAYVTPLTSVTSDTSSDKTYLHNLETYEKMAWLISQYPSQNLTNQAAIQWVIWDLSLGNQSHSGYYSQYNTWLTQAQANYTQGDYTGWQILTDVNGKEQEFMIDPVPEPSTLLLLGAGLLGLGGFARLRRKFKKS